MRNQLHQCDCGTVHSRTTFLNADTSNWLCAPCVKAIDKAEAQRKQLALELSRLQWEHVSKPENMFREYLRTKRNHEGRR